MTSTSRKAPDDHSPTATPPSFIRSLTTRTSLITAVAIAGVVLAGGAAIAANIGILSAANSSPIGGLTATELVATPSSVDTTASTTSTTSTTIPTTIPTTTPMAPTSDYVVDDAGTVSLTASDAGLALATATASDGWTPALSQSEPTSLTVVFTNGSRTVVFTATLGADGTIIADVTEPVVVTGTVPNGPVTIPTTPSYDDSDDDSYDGDSYDDDDDRDDDSYDDGDEDEDEDKDKDDEEHEYDGADDDD